MLVDLPTHWLGAVWLGAAWSLGMRVSDDTARVGEADLVVCGPEGVERYADLAARVPVVAVSLRPLGARFAEPLPAGVVDYGAVVLGQPDSFVAFDPPLPDDPAWEDGSGALLTQADLVATPPVGDGHGGRLLTDVGTHDPARARHPARAAARRRGHGVGAPPRRGRLAAPVRRRAGDRLPARARLSRPLSR